MGFNVKNPFIKDVALMGLDFWADGRDPSTPGFRPDTDTYGIQILGKLNRLLIEDCAVRGYATNIALWNGNGPIDDVTIRRSVVVDAFKTTPGNHPQGLFADGRQRADARGERLRPQRLERAASPAAKATMFNHNVYVTDNVPASSSAATSSPTPPATASRRRPGGDRRGQPVPQQPDRHVASAW